MYSHVCWKSGFESTRRDIKVHWRGLLNLPTVCQFLDVSCARTSNELVSQVPESNRFCCWHPSCSAIRGMTQFAALVLVLVLGLTTPAVALTTYYVDPNWGGTQSGSASQPWNDVNGLSKWNTINASLANDDVTVYFSARNAGSDTNVATTTGIGLDRTDTGTHRLTLDGMSKYNTSEVTPSWVTYSGPSRFQVTTSYPMGSDNFNSPYPNRDYITIRGFRLIATDGQIAALQGMNHLIFELNEGSTQNIPGTGPGVITGVPVSGVGLTGPSHIIIRNNNIHDSRGECLYIDGSTPDPPGSGSPVNTGDDTLIQGNTFTDCGRSGHQGDGTDVKDGHTNLRIINNVYTHPHFNMATGLYDTGYNCDCQGIVVESADLIAGNYIEAPAHSGIELSASWNTQVGRNQLVIRNNVIVNVGYAGIWLANASSSSYQWSNTKVYNNSIFTTSIECILISGPQGNVTVANNILHTCGSSGLASDTAGQLAMHDYNIFFNVSGNALANAGANTTCANIARVEAHASCSDPAFVSTSTPYAATNFKPGVGSQAIGAALDLSGTFTDDYAGVTRGVPWDIGPFAVFGVLAAPNPPTQLRLR